MLAAAHSRIPIFCESRHNVIGLILVKMLIKLSPKDATPISQLIPDPNCFRKVPSVPHDMALFDLLNLFQTGKSKSFLFILCIAQKLYKSGHWGVRILPKVVYTMNI